MRKRSGIGMALAAGALVASVVCAVPALAESYAFTLPDEGRSDVVEVTSVDGTRYFRLSDVARTVGASRHWNARTSKMTLAVGPHRISMTSDSQFVSVDGEAHGLGRPVLFRQGAFWVPPAFVTDALGLALNSDVAIDGAELTVSFTRLGAELSVVSVEDRPDETAVLVYLNDRAQFAVRSRERGRIDLFIHGARIGEPPTEENVGPGRDPGAASDTLGAPTLREPAEERPGEGESGEPAPAGTNGRPAAQQMAGVASSDSAVADATAPREVGPVTFEGDGLVSSVTAENTDAGVAVVIRVAPSATAYDAEFKSGPYRIEVDVWSGGRGAIPAPLLRGTKHLLSPDLPSEGRDGAISTVMLDPGHGGSDTGYVNRQGRAEKDVALAVAEDVAQYLRGEGFYVFMTRSSDSYVPIKRRAEIANLADSDVFVSIHMGSWHSGGAGGFRVSYYSPAGEDVPDAAAAGTRGLRRVMPGARPEAVRDIEWGASQERLMEDSRTLARLVHDRMAASEELRDRGTGAVDLSVLAGCSMPAILVEVAFLSNATDASLLENAQFRSDVARSIAAGVADFRNAWRERDQ